MGIRETSYYGWENIYVEGSTATESALTRFRSMAIDSSGSIYVCGDRDSIWFVRKSTDEGNSWETIDNEISGAAYGIAVDSNDNIYVCGADGEFPTYTRFAVRKSTTGLSGSFSYIESVNNLGLGNDAARDIAIDSNDNVYVCGYKNMTGDSTNWFVRKSTTGLSGSFTDVDVFDRDGSTDEAYGVAIDSNDYVYVCGREGVDTPSQGTNWVVRKSTTGNFATFSYIDNVNTSDFRDIGYGIAIDSNDNIYVCGDNQTTSGFSWGVRKSTTGLSSSFSYIDSVDTVGVNHMERITVDSNDNIFICGYTVGPIDWTVRRSFTGTSGSFLFIDKIEGSTSTAEKVIVDSNDNIYICGALGSFGIIRKGRLTANSASLGSKMLSPSVGYVFSEISGTETEKFKLMNISEFPHSSGIYQMPNLVIGTTDSGKIGKTEDDIIQINYIGSVVHILWPKQEDQSIPVKGFGDFSIGQRAGKLTTQFEPGEIIEVTGYDHLTLYYYLLKQEVGTLDYLEIKVERRPLKDSPFVIESTIEYTTSGSISVAELKDLHYKREIDYSDLSVKEIGNPIDIPLVNVKEIRISARHMVGQSEANKSFICWGRLIKSDEET